MSRMAKDYLSVMATSAPIEREFSIFSNIITRNRNSLDKENARRIILLKNWKIPEISVNEVDSEEEIIIPNQEINSDSNIDSEDD
jgi:hAT family C-terminal dimerisation region